VEKAGKKENEFVKALSEIDSSRVRVVQQAEDAKFRVPVRGTTGLLSQAEVRPATIKDVVSSDGGREGRREERREKGGDKRSEKRREKREEEEDERGTIGSPLISTSFR
jgi:hypothetical protein